MSKVYAFDVDETLSCSGGPIGPDALMALRANGDIVGLCGNWAMAVARWPDWWKFVSFIGPLSMTKPEFLDHLELYVPATEYVMVGNIKGVSGASDDKGAADAAGWRFIRESTFAAGER